MEQYITFSQYMNQLFRKPAVNPPSRIHDRIFDHIVSSSPNTYIFLTDICLII